MTLQDIISKFNTTPFLFAGSGITRRYYGLPDWEELLQHFVQKISADRFAYSAYYNKACATASPTGVLPKVASLLQADFDRLWFAHSELRTLDESGMLQVENGTSPFKAEVAAYIKSKSTPLPQYANELLRLKNISKKNISGVITTNYDQFFETQFDNYKTYIGQDQLVFSAIQGIAEIYKIHGSVTDPSSLVLNEQDYKKFNSKSKYLAAKLMTIFMEYPIIFIGYSLTDTNIQNILLDIVTCLPNDKIAELQTRFIFVDWNPDIAGYTINTHSLTLGDKVLSMTKITLNDFSPLYNALAAKEAKVPIRFLRRFREEIYSYALTSQPGPVVNVADLDNENLDEDALAISIGLRTNGELGLVSAADANTWHRNIITDELTKMGFTYDQLLDIAYAHVKKEACGNVSNNVVALPLHKYLTLSKYPHTDVAADKAPSFDSILTKTNRNNRHTTEKYSSALDLWKKEKQDKKRVLRLLVCLPEETCPADELEIILKEIFEIDENALTNKSDWTPSDVKRLIRLYDYVRWGKKKDPET